MPLVSCSKIVSEALGKINEDKASQDRVLSLSIIPLLLPSSHNSMHVKHAWCVCVSICVSVFVSLPLLVSRLTGFHGCLPLTHFLPGLDARDHDRAVLFLPGWWR